MANAQQISITSSDNLNAALEDYTSLALSPGRYPFDGLVVKEARQLQGLGSPASVVLYCTHQNANFTVHETLDISNVTIEDCAQAIQCNGSATIRLERVRVERSKISIFRSL